MEFSINYTREVDDPKSGPAQVGWFMAKTQTPGVIFYPPERVKSVDVNRQHAKSASRCPAVINMESRYFMVRSPIDFHLGFSRDKSGKPVLINHDKQASSVRGHSLGKIFSIASEPEWRRPNCPTIQLKLPYVFVSDEVIYISQVAPFMHYVAPAWPGTIFGGRFPITNWPRPLMWAFEWYETDKPLKVKRGDPLFYIMFETDRPDRSVQVIESEVTPEVQAYLDHIGGAVSFVNQTFSLFQEAARVRPATMVHPKKR